MTSSKTIDLYRDFAAGVIRVYRLEIQSVMLVFSTQLRELLPLLRSLWFTSASPPPLPPSQYSIYRLRVAGRGFGALSPVCWRPYSAGFLHS
jgi:hypothetical protein